jgi:hypothetical protein
MGIGDWGLGIGDWGFGPIPNPQSPIPNPQSPIPIIFLSIMLLQKILKINIFKIKINKLSSIKNNVKTSYL